MKAAWTRSDAVVDHAKDSGRALPSPELLHTEPPRQSLAHSSPIHRPSHRIRRAFNLAAVGLAIASRPPLAARRHSGGELTV